MAKQILEYNQSVNKTLTAVEMYALKGHRESSMVILTKEENADKIVDHTEVLIKTNHPTPEEDKGILDKVKEKVIPYAEVELNSEEKLINFGLTQTDAKTAIQKMNEGYFVILVDEHQRMGHPDES